MLHPVTHESVIWISGRTYPLASLFSLAAIAWILQRANRRPSPTDHLVLVSLVIGALLSYEAALILPLLLMPVMVTSRGGGPVATLAHAVAGPSGLSRGTLWSSDNPH